MSYKAKWWELANDRRQRLIYNKYQASAYFTKEQEEELAMLQGVAGLVSSYVMGDPDKWPISKALKKAERLLRKIQKAKALTETSERSKQ
jgi:uncharacterized lipoprotein YddW (UPF0748 family)